MEITPYLSFNGQCEAAFKFYESCFRGKITILMPYGQTPMAPHIPAESHGKIVHARLVAGKTTLMGGDAIHSTGCPGYVTPQGFSVSIGIEDPVEGERIFKALSENGTVRMPYEETFWAVRFGMVIDQFGIPWLINCEKCA